MCRKGIDYFRKNIVGDVIEKLWQCAEFLAVFWTADHDTLSTFSDARPSCFSLVHWVFRFGLATSQL
jgi:hypothetical protein